MRKSHVFEWIEAFLEAAALAAVLFFLFWPVLIDGASMENTFNSGDRVVISRVMAYSGMVGNGDVVICRLRDEGKPAIKRVIASNGDKIVISNNTVMVNDIKLNEPYIKTDKTSGNINITLKKDEYFVLGDNRALSYDSRRAGIITKKDIVGKVILRWYPFNEMKFIIK